MTNTELAAYVGLKGFLVAGLLNVLVRSLDAREVYGRLDILVEPVAGTGKAWVSESRIAWQAEDVPPTCP